MHIFSLVWYEPSKFTCYGSLRSNNVVAYEQKL